MADNKSNPQSEQKKVAFTTIGAIGIGIIILISIVYYVFSM